MVGESENGRRCPNTSGVPKIVGGAQNSQRLESSRVPKNVGGAPNLTKRSVLNLPVGGVKNGRRCKNGRGYQKQ